MKSQIIKSILVIIIAFGLQSSSYISTNKSIKVIAKYDGFDDIGFSFSYEEKGLVKTITFEEIKDELLEKYDLENDTYVEEKFEVLYKVATSEDDEESAVFVLESLKLIEE